MKTIWKFKIPVVDYPVVKMPAGARVLHVAPGRTPDQLWLWAEIDTEAPEEDRAFRIFGTGHPMHEVGPHLGTVEDGILVWHLYELETDR